jgi:hypothetical protein
MTDLLHQLHMIADTCDKHGITGLRSRKRAARKIVAATVEIDRLRLAATEFVAWFERAVATEYTSRKPMPANCERTLSALKALLTPNTGA